MKFLLAILFGLLGLAGFAPISGAQSAQTSPNTAGAQPNPVSVRPVSSLPDWAGIWVLDFPKRGDPPAEEPSLTPTAAAELKVLKDEEAKNQEPPTESANCLPPGMPTIMFQHMMWSFCSRPGV